MWKYFTPSADADNVGGGCDFGGDGVVAVVVVVAIACSILVMRVSVVVHPMAFDPVDDHFPWYVGLERPILPPRVANCIDSDCMDYHQSHEGSENEKKSIVSTCVSTDNES